MDVPEPYCHGYLERLAFSAGYAKGKVEAGRGGGVMETTWIIDSWYAAIAHVRKGRWEQVCEFAAEEEELAREQMRELAAQGLPVRLRKQTRQTFQIIKPPWPLEAPVT